MELDTTSNSILRTIDWFKYLDIYLDDFGDKCHKKRKRNVAKKLLMKKITTLHLTTILKDALLKSQLEIINPVTKDITSQN